MQHVLEVETRERDAWCDITAQVARLVHDAGATEGVVTLFVPHTTAAVTIQENADPPLKQDITRALAQVFPRAGNYGHCEDNAAAHMKAVLVGASVQVPFAAGKLRLGTWQGIYLCEFDGPRRRQVVVQVA